MAGSEFASWRAAAEARRELYSNRFRQSAVGGSKAVAPAAVAPAAGGSLLGNADRNRGQEQYRHFTGWPYVAIRSIANRIAGQPFHVGRVRASGTAERNWPGHRKGQMSPHVKQLATMGDLEPLPTHPLMVTIQRPNPIQTCWALMYMTVASLELTGKAYWWLVDVKGQLQLWPIPTHWIRPVHTKGIFAEYEIQPPGAAKPEIVDGRLVAYFSLPDPSDPLGSVSPLQSQAKAVTADEHLQETQARHFLNGFFPGLVMTVGRLPGMPSGPPGHRPVLTRDQRKVIHLLAQQMYQGSEKAGQPFVVDGMIESVQPFTTAPREMDYSNSGQIVKSRILQAYGVNPIIVGETQGANRAQAVVAEQNFASNVINPVLALMSQVSTVWFSGWYNDPGLVSWWEPATANDEELDLQKWNKGIDSGVVTVNEWRTNVLNLPPQKGGDVYLRQAAIIEVEPGRGTGAPLTDQGEELPPLPDESDDEDGGDDDEEDDQAGVRSKSAGSKSYREGILQWYKQEHAASYQRAEAIVQRTMMKFFGEQVRDIVANLGESTPAAVRTESIFSPRRWDQKLRETLDAVLFEVATLGAKQEQTLRDVRSGTRSLEWAKSPAVGSSADTPLPPDVVDAVRAQIRQSLEAEYWQNINSTTANELRKLILQATEDGWSNRRLSQEITSKLGDEFSNRRANGIARTETNAALSAGHQAVYEDQERRGETVTKEWVSILDNSTRPTHVAADGQIVRGADARFRVGGSTAPYPGHPSLPVGERSRCRCTTISRTVLDDIIEGRVAERNEGVKPLVETDYDPRDYVDVGDGIHTHRPTRKNPMKKPNYIKENLDDPTVQKLIREAQRKNGLLDKSNRGEKLTEEEEEELDELDQLLRRNAALGATITGFNLISTGDPGRNRAFADEMRRETGKKKRVVRGGMGRITGNAAVAAGKLNEFGPNDIVVLEIKTKRGLWMEEIVQQPQSADIMLADNARFEVVRVVKNVPWMIRGVKRLVMVVTLKEVEEEVEDKPARRSNKGAKNAPVGDEPVQGVDADRFTITNPERLFVFGVDPA